MRNTGRHARTSIALALALLGAGTSCSGDATGPGDGRGPGDGPEPAVLTTLEVTPAVAELCAPGSAVQLTIVARDQNGAEIPIGTGTATYSSSAPEIAGVGNGGVVAGAAPGTAVITATFAFGGKTLSALMKAAVREAAAAYPAIAGVYDVNALITQSGWGAEGVHETAILTIQHSRDAPVFAGTFEDLRFFERGSDVSMGEPLSGSVSGYFDCAGRVVFELRMDGLQSSLWHAEGTVVAQQITGHFWDPGSNSGTFAAERRPEE